jgi:putative membrane protein
MTLVRRAMVLGCGAALALVVPLAALPLRSPVSRTPTGWWLPQRPLAEIAPGNAALEQASTQQVRDLGQMFVDTHTQVDADLTPRQETSTSTCPTPEQEQQLRT